MGAVPAAVSCLWRYLLLPPAVSPAEPQGGSAPQGTGAGAAFPPHLRKWDADFADEHGFRRTIACEGGRGSKSDVTVSSAAAIGLPGRFAPLKQV